MHNTDPDKENTLNASIQQDNNDQLHESLRKNLNKNKSPEQKKQNAAAAGLLSPKEDFDKYESEFQVLDETDVNEISFEEKHSDTEESLDLPTKSYVPPSTANVQLQEDEDSIEEIKEQPKKEQKAAPIVEESEPEASVTNQQDDEYNFTSQEESEEEESEESEESSEDSEEERER